MPSNIGNEFWREIKPIDQVFKPDAKSEVYIGDASTLDKRYYMPLSDTVYDRPLWISPSQNKWCDIMLSEGAGLLNRHYHTDDVFSYTISGKWGYLEHDWVAKAGDFIYEAPGEAHTLVAYETPEPMQIFFIVKGPVIWLDEDGNAQDYLDVHGYIDMCRKHYESVGIGGDYVNSLFR